MTSCRESPRVHNDQHYGFHELVFQEKIFSTQLKSGHQNRNLVSPKLSVWDDP